MCFLEVTLHREGLPVSPEVSSCLLYFVSALRTSFVYTTMWGSWWWLFPVALSGKIRPDKSIFKFGGNFSLLQSTSSQALEWGMSFPGPRLL